MERTTLLHSQDIYISAIVQIYSERKNRNKYYSKRSLAIDLNIDPSDLLNILKNKKNITPKIAYKIGTHLNLNKEQLLDFIEPVLKN